MKRRRVATIGELKRLPDKVKLQIFDQHLEEIAKACDLHWESDE
tara:strand:+ start:107 stop:238 length:132 start_codon:yes stop_codon:yes gene_type:complete